VSNLVISIYKYNKDYASLLIEEENGEESENESSEYKDYSFMALHEFNAAIIGQAGINYFSLDIPFTSSYLNKPETPPPNPC
jgi:hypothetical protein